MNSNVICLNDCTSSMTELDLQQVFNDWSGSKVGWRIAGAPNWLLQNKGPNLARGFSAKNRSAYTFCPDVLLEGHNGCYVLELKRSAKYEPLALAEVLHHAWKMADAASSWNGPPPVPVMVTSSTDSAWQRGALNYLFNNGLSRTALRYLEVTFLREGVVPGYLWIDEPFAACSPIEAPPNCIPITWQNRDTTWYKVDECDTWISADGPVDLQNAYIPNSFVRVSNVTDVEECLILQWQGERGSWYVVRVAKDGDTVLQ